MKLLSFKHNCYLRPLLMVVFLMLLLFSGIVSAKAEESTDPIGEKLCNIVGILSGKTTKALCLVAIVVLGITTFMGKVNMSTAVITICAIIITTQSAKVYEFIAGKDTNGKSTTCEKSS
ncbi:TrbC/VirB2 family protein [Orientia tsutsugamushi]|uniref:TrbC/VIRB2 family protein n=1 Tax=Orientia tsutsugamushi str. TA716 TaxID=1359175 RepID=A0A0F3PBG7_ORITS|nr:TrbC/VirB2 family protein [Orientia tsutsugamushi]KJV77292.1 trbC/VIRB2 family protein [Orientia tsutsugamushi str. TA716]